MELLVILFLFLALFWMVSDLPMHRSLRRASRVILLLLFLGILLNLVGFVDFRPYDHHHYWH